MGNLSCAYSTYPEGKNVKRETLDIFITKLIDNKEWKIIHKLLSDNPSEVAKKDKIHGRLPIHRAIIHNAPVYLIEAIIQLYPVAMTTPDQLGNLPFYYAIINNANYAIFLLLLSYNIEGLKKADKEGQIALHLAITRKMNESIILLFINTFPESVTKKTKLGKHSLHFACEYNAPINIFKAILGYNMDPSVVTNSRFNNNNNRINSNAVRLNSPNSPTSPPDSPSTPSRNIGQAGGPRRHSTTSVPEKSSTTPKNTLLSPRNTTNSKVPLTDTSSIGSVVTVINTLTHDLFNSKLPLHIACESKASFEAIHLLVTSYPESVSIQGGESMYAIHYALANKACIDVIALLTDGKCVCCDDAM